MKLLPCPFCNGKAEYWTDKQWQDCHVIECEDCGTQKRSEYLHCIADDWNTRHGKLELAND